MQEAYLEFRSRPIDFPSFPSFSLTFLSSVSFSYLHLDLSSQLYLFLPYLPFYLPSHFTFPFLTYPFPFLPNVTFPFPTYPFTFLLTLPFLSLPTPSPSVPSLPFPSLPTPSPSFTSLPFPFLTYPFTFLPIFTFPFWIFSLILLWFLLINDIQSFADLSISNFKPRLRISSLKRPWRWLIWFYPWNLTQFILFNCMTLTPFNIFLITWFPLISFKWTHSGKDTGTNWIKYIK